MFNYRIFSGVIVDFLKVAILFTIASQHSFAQSSDFMPKGRIAISSDGNLHDSDDWGATAFSLAFIDAAGLNGRLVHYDYNNHLGESRKTWEDYMLEAAEGGAERFNFDASKFFNDQVEKEEAIENFKKEALKCTSENPLWLICAGPMQMVYDMVAEVPKQKRQFIYAISHGKWNEDHQHGILKKTWADLKSDFPELKYYEIIDQNKSNGEDDFQSHYNNWQWLVTSGNDNWNWLYERDDTHEVDELENWKSNAKEHFDISDVGMTYWLLSGGPNNGNDRAGWKEAKLLLESGTLIQRLPTNPDDIVIFEAESTTTDLGQWSLIGEGDKNYIEGASQKKFLEFLGNNPDQGEPDSPLEYRFKVAQDGKYRLLLMTSKRLEGARGDMCNDAWVKLEGPFDSATTLPLNDLKEYLKFFQEGSTKTPERSWQWALRAEKGRHQFHELIYKLGKDQEYKLTIAGRSRRFSIDYIVFYNTERMSRQEAEKLAVTSISTH